MYPTKLKRLVTYWASNQNHSEHHSALVLLSMSIIFIICFKYSVNFHTKSMCMHISLLIFESQRYVNLL